MKTKVENLRHFGYASLPDGSIRIDRRTIYGNPFKIGPDGTREDVIAKHKKYMLERIAVDLEFKEAVLALKGKILLCWCAPLPCHGDNYVVWLEKGE